MGPKRKHAAISSPPDAAASPHDATPKRGPGRPKKAAIAPASQAEPKKRGRPSANVTATDQKVVPAKTRGRPARNATLAALPLNEDINPKGRGRPRKHQVDNASLTASRASPRSRKTAAAPDPPISKRPGRGRPPSKSSKPEKPAPRLDPKIRSKLRDRSQILKEKNAKTAAAAAAEEKANPPALTRRGRPGRPRKAIVPSPRKTTALKSARSAVAKPRARRGHVFWEVPQEYLPRLQQHLLDLQSADEAELQPENGDDAVEQVAQVEEIEVIAGDQNIEDQIAEEMDIDVHQGAQEEGYGVVAKDEVVEDDVADDADVAETMLAVVEDETPQNIDQDQTHEEGLVINESASLLDGIVETIHQASQAPLALMGN